VSNTFVTPEAALGRPRTGDGTRLVDRELSKMVAKVDKGNAMTGTETVTDLIDRGLAHCEHW
jgi:hypothetical protein